MEKFAFLLKTYDKDLDRAEKLLNSFVQYNDEGMKCYVVAPRECIKQMAIRTNVCYIPEDTFGGLVSSKVNGIQPGYVNQEIIKLSFWEKGICENYCCLDSDAIFIRPFYMKDFMFDDNTPYTVLFEDHDLQADLYYNREFWNSRMEQIKKIEDELDYHPYHLKTCHGFQIFSSRVLKSLKSDFMEPRGYSYKNLIEISPYEFSWYNLWLQKMEIIPIHEIESLFKCIHLKQHHIQYVLNGMKVEDWLRGRYVGIVVNSNYGVGEGDYYDLSVYNGFNAGISDDIVEMNYRFYKRIRKGWINRKIRPLLSAIKRQYTRNR